MIVVQYLIIIGLAIALRPLMVRLWALILRPYVIRDAERITKGV